MDISNCQKTNNAGFKKSKKLHTIAELRLAEPNMLFFAAMTTSV
jgi:hypothetical protein